MHLYTTHHIANITPHVNDINDKSTIEFNEFYNAIINVPTDEANYNVTNASINEFGPVNNACNHHDIMVIRLILGL